MLWVHVKSTTRFEKSFRDIIDYVEISERHDFKTDVFRLVYDWLRDEKSEQWLFILDNVDNTDLFFEIENVN